jgi:hypothetical protein
MKCFRRCKFSFKILVKPFAYSLQSPQRYSMQTVRRTLMRTKCTTRFMRSSIYKVQHFMACLQSILLFAGVYLLLMPTDLHRSLQLIKHDFMFQLPRKIINITAWLSYHTSLAKQCGYYCVGGQGLLPY